MGDKGLGDKFEGVVVGDVLEQIKLMFVPKTSATTFSLIYGPLPSYSYAKVVDLDNGKDDDDDFDWLNPPKLVVDKHKPHESSTVKEIRQKQQELLSITESAKAIVQEDNVKRDLKSSMDFASESPDEKPSRPAAERSKIVISIQDKDGQKQFRVYTDDKFERLFKMYADKANLKVENLVFCFDGDKVDPAATPSSLELEDNDMIEVNVKSS